MESIFSLSSTLTIVSSIFTENIFTNLNRKHLPFPHPDQVDKKKDAI